MTKAILSEESAAARSRYVEQELAAAIARGATQFVVLGAGLNAFAIRNSNPRLRVFEFDHAEDKPLPALLEASGFRPDEISVFAWFGTSPYATAEAAIRTLAFIGSLPTGTSLVFDYTAERSSPDSVTPTAMDALASRVTNGGEPLLVLRPHALNRMLRSAGFRHIEDLGPSGIGRGLAHLVNART